MAAPINDIVWGPIYGDYGRLGIYRKVTKSGSTASVNVQVWFWSKYSVTDANNDFLYDVGTNITEATTIIGAVSIKHTVSSGEGWSTSNQTKLIDRTYSYNLGKSATTYKVYTSFKSIDKVGSRMYANTTYTVPALDSYTVAYDANGGSGAPSSQTKWYGESLTLSSTKPTRTGYSFQGWSTSSDTTVEYDSGASYTENAAVTLYAVWKANTYPVKYDANGGTGAPGNQTKTYGQTLKLSTTIPTLENYNFLGWGTSASATTVSYAAGADYTVNAAITLYAIWELAYVKPRITNVSISRCLSNSQPSDSGKNGFLTFDWASDRLLTSIVVTWKSATGGSGSTTITDSGTSGSVSVIIGDDSLSTDVTYSIQITVTDEVNSTTVNATLGGTKFVVDFLSGGNGAAFGKPAELSNILDISFQTKFRGGIQNEVLEKYNDLNNVLIPNTYVSVNKGATEYSNCPIASGTFVLEVMSAGAEGQVFQRLTTTFKETHETYERHYYQGSWGNWVRTRKDTGWIDLELQSGITLGTEVGYLKGRIKNDVLYIKGDVVGIDANWKYFAKLPASLISDKLASATRFAGVYNMSNFCGLSLMSNGQLYVSANSSGAWDATKMVAVNISICL